MTLHNPIVARLVNRLNVLILRISRSPAFGDVAPKRQFMLVSA